MKILLDHNLDRRLKQYLLDCEPSTAQEMGWSDVSNGELLSLLEEDGFDVLLTADRSIKNQQNLTGRKIAMLVLCASDNRLKTHLEMVPEIQICLMRIREGEVLEIDQRDILK